MAKKTRIKLKKENQSLNENSFKILFATTVLTIISIISVFLITSKIIKMKNPPSAAEKKPEQTVLIFYQDYINNHDTYKNSPYVTENFVKTIEQNSFSIPKGISPILFADSNPNCGITTSNLTISDNNATVNINLCYNIGVKTDKKNTGENIIQANLIKKDDQWKLDFIKLIKIANSQ